MALQLSLDELLDGRKMAQGHNKKTFLRLNERHMGRQRPYVTCTCTCKQACFAFPGNQGNTHQFNPMMISPECSRGHVVLPCP